MASAAEPASFETHGPQIRTNGPRQPGRIGATLPGERRPDVTESHDYEVQNRQHRHQVKLSSTASRGVSQVPVDLDVVEDEGLRGAGGVSMIVTTSAVPTPKWAIGLTPAE